MDNNVFYILKLSKIFILYCKLWIKMKKIMFFILLLFLAELVSSQLILTEIMANPDSGDEWLEFYAQEDFSLDGTQISDNYQTDDVVCCNQSTCNMSVRKGEYFLITNMENTVYADFFYGHLTGKNQTAEAENTINFTTPKMFCVDDKSIGNGLGNTEDIITLAQGEETFLEFYYEVSFPKGISYSYFNKTWNFSMPSPWKENVLFAVVHEEISHKIGYFYSRRWTMSDFACFSIF